MIDWALHGFNEDPEYEGCYSHPEIPLVFYEKDGFVKVAAGDDMYVISEGRIPMTNRQIELIKKAFCVE